MSDRLYTPLRIGDMTPEDLLFKRRRRLFTNILHRRGGEVKVSRHIAVFVDGACLCNGQPSARGGIGVYFGPDSRHNISKHLARGRQTNQRAEVGAAIAALIKIKELLDDDKLDTNLVVLASDSEYLVKGITERIYKWQDNGWTNARGVDVANRDEFEELDSLVDELEDDYGTFVKFWKVDREDNEDADELAKGGSIR